MLLSLLMQVLLISKITQPSQGKCDVRDDFAVDPLTAALARQNKGQQLPERYVVHLKSLAASTASITYLL